MRFYACLKPDEHHASNGWQHAGSQKDINKIAKQRQAESSHYYIIQKCFYDKTNAESRHTCTGSSGLRTNNQQTCHFDLILGIYMSI